MFSRKQSESEFADELDSHLQMHIDDNLRAGMTAKQARRDAILKLGGVESTAQAYRERGTVPFLENLLLDIRFACARRGYSCLCFCRLWSSAVGAESPCSCPLDVVSIGCSDYLLGRACLHRTIVSPKL